MTLSLTTNTTCDVYRAGNAPPAAADVGNVPCRLEANFGLGMETGEGDGVAKKFTHTMLVDFRSDIRDDYDAGTIGPAADTVYVPDKNGTAFKVVFVEGAGVSRSHKKIYLAREAVTWPSNEL